MTLPPNTQVRILLIVPWLLSQYNADALEGFTEVEWVPYRDVLSAIDSIFSDRIDSYLLRKYLPSMLPTDMVGNSFHCLKAWVCDGSDHSIQYTVKLASGVEYRLADYFPRVEVFALKDRPDYNMGTDPDPVVSIESTPRNAIVRTVNQ